MRVRRGRPEAGWMMQWEAGRIGKRGPQGFDDGSNVNVNVIQARPLPWTSMLPGELGLYSTIQYEYTLVYIDSLAMDTVQVESPHAMCHHAFAHLSQHPMLLKKSPAHVLVQV